MTVSLCAHKLRLLWRPEKGIRFPGAGITGEHEEPKKVIETEMSPLEKQQALLTT